MWVISNRWLNKKEIYLELLEEQALRTVIIIVNMIVMQSEVEITKEEDIHKEEAIEAIKEALEKITMIIEIDQ